MKRRDVPKFGSVECEQLLCWMRAGALDDTERDIAVRLITHSVLDYVRPVAAKRVGRFPTPLYSGESGTDDLIQDVLVDVLRKLNAGELDPARGVRAFVGTIVHRKVVNAIRSAKIRRTDLESAMLPPKVGAGEASDGGFFETVASSDGDAVPDRVVDHSRMYEALKRCLSALQELHRWAVLMKDEQLMTNEQIASHLGTSCKTARNWIRGGRDSVRACMSRQGFDQQWLAED